MGDREARLEPALVLLDWPGSPSSGRGGFSCLRAQSRGHTCGGRTPKVGELPVELASKLL